jgi:hypothetical protein
MEEFFTLAQGQIVRRGHKLQQKFHLQAFASFLAIWHIAQLTLRNIHFFAILIHPNPSRGFNAETQSGNAK